MPKSLWSNVKGGVIVKTFNHKYMWYPTRWDGSWPVPCSPGSWIMGMESKENPGSTTDGSYYYSKLHRSVVTTRVNISYLLCTRHYTKPFAFIWLNDLNIPCHKYYYHYYYYYYPHNGKEGLECQLQLLAESLGPGRRSLTIWFCEYFGYYKATTLSPPFPQNCLLSPLKEDTG